MAIGGRWRFERYHTNMLAPRREIIVLNILRKKPLNVWEIWTAAQKERPPLDWDALEDAIISLGKQGLITRLKED